MSAKDTPENLLANRKRIRAAVEKALRTTDPTTALTGVVLAERVALRETIASEILEPLIDRYEDGLNNDQMDTLVWVVRHFIKTPSGEIVLDKPPPNARKQGLRVVE